MICLGTAEISNAQLVMRNRNRVLSGSPAELLAQLIALPGVPAANMLDFRRGCAKVRFAMLGATAALFDAGIPPSDRIALIGAGTDGSRTENLVYFQDYTEHGRDGGRGQLFVGTLPTTPLCEAAIALSLHGPAFYLDTNGDRGQLNQELELTLADPAIDAVLLFEFAPDTLKVSLVAQCASC